MLKMQQATHQICSERPSLLILNDDCLREIFQFLQLHEFSNLAVTCSRLLSVAQQSKKYKDIKVTRCGSYTVQEFAKILSVIGGNVVSVHVGVGTFAILKTIADTNSGIAELDSYYSSQLGGQLNICNLKSLQGVLPFRNLKELRFSCHNYLSIDDWRNCFENNRGIETIQFEDDGDTNCLPLLQMLPQLKSLTINDLYRLEDVHHLFCLTSLTKLNIWVQFECNQLLIELAEKLKLVELVIDIPCDTDTFGIIKTFRHLEMLLMVNLNHSRLRVPQTTIFPKMLKKIELHRCRISCSHFLSIVKQLTLLEEFAFYDGAIFWDNNEVEYFPKHPSQPGDIQSSKIISRIAKELRVQKRNLKIIFINDSKDNRVYKCSDNLEIIIRPEDDEATLAFDCYPFPGLNNLLIV